MNFHRFGGTLALASMAWFVVLGTAHTALGPTSAQASDADSLVLALQEICSATGLRKEAGKMPPSPARDGLPPCTLCCSLGQLPLDLVPDTETPIRSAIRALPIAPAGERAANSLRTGLPPSRGPPTFLF